MRICSTFALVGVVALITQAEGEEHLRVNVFPGPQHLALYVAQDKGFFAKRGLSIEVEFTPTSKAQRDALADGRVQIAQSAVDNAVAWSRAQKRT
jgi:ABC-type nitrate/sulfonate/bicarbonate transport system substrate-binding protein